MPDFRIMARSSADERADEPSFCKRSLGLFSGAKSVIFMHLLVKIVVYIVYPNLSSAGVVLEGRPIAPKSLKF